MRLLRWEPSGLGLRLELALLLGARLTTSNGLRGSRAQWRVGVARLGSTGGTVFMWLHALEWWGGTFLASTWQETTRFILLVSRVEGGKILLTRGIFARDRFCRVLGIGHERATTSILLVRNVTS